MLANFQRKGLFYFAGQSHRLVFCLIKIEDLILGDSSPSLSFTYLVLLTDGQALIPRSYNLSFCLSIFLFHSHILFICLSLYFLPTPHVVAVGFSLSFSVALSVCQSIFLFFLSLCLKLLFLSLFV